MPKYCSVPYCKNDAGNGNERKSFYKFPLHDPVRLQQWLKNMGREEWIPSRHQYICHEHFTGSCFKIRWGVRYLENDAVPTVFQAVEKRKADDYIENKPKRLRGNTPLRRNMSDNREAAADNMEPEKLNTLHLYEVTVDPSQLEETVGLLVETNYVKEPLESLQTTLHPPVSVDEFDTEGTFPVAIFQSVDDLTGLTSEVNAEVVVVSEYPASEGQVELVNGITTPVLSEVQKLLTTDSAVRHSEKSKTYLGFEDVTAGTEDSSVVADCGAAEVIAYFETIPSVLPTGISAQFTTFPDTVLSSALGSTPIVSILPIVSKYMPPSPSSLVLTMERLDPQGDSGKSEHVRFHEQDLEEHSYYKNSLSKEQLEAIVSELQRKVKVLQQRHRRHLEKLLSLENTVSQLKQNNLLNEERLQLLERAYVQTSASVSDGGEAVAVFYEEESGAFFFCVPVNDGEEGLCG